MSRRKQSNPKPLKREDEEWGTESEAMHGDARAHTPGSPEPRPASSAASPATSPAAAASPAPSAAATPPRLRLNASLATDPALAPSAAAIKSEPDEAPPPPPPAAAPLAPRDYLAALPAALSSAIAAGLFPPPARPDSERPPPPAVPVYMCAPCGIRYSSPSTLEAHRTYYCSHRPGKPAGDADAGGGADGDDTADAAGKARAGKQYACTHCSYSAEKKVSLNRHMRMHASSPSPPRPSAPPSAHSNGDAEPSRSPAAAATAGGSPALAHDRYCADCDIRFSSTKTYRAHKTHYCNTRQVVKPAARSGSSCTSGSAPPSPNEQRVTPPASAAPPPQPFLALPTNPILIVPYSLFRGASVLPGSTVAGLPDNDTPCFLLPNGTIHPMTRAFAAAVDGKEPEVLKSANRPRDAHAPRDPGAPLDLSMRRSPEAADHEKENRMRRSATPEQIVCAPSLPGSPGTPGTTGTPSPTQRRSPSPPGAPEPKRRRRESRGATPKPAEAEDKFPAGLHPLLMRGGGGPSLPPELAMRLAEMPPLPAPPAQVLVKQGVSKCKECNIVFCKYENYLVHKRLYCSTRGRGEDGDGAASPAPAQDGSAPHYRQLICLACGIKFNSMDNLVAHQSFYCTKRDTAHEERARCGKCKAPHSPGRPCSAGGGGGAAGGGGGAAGGGAGDAAGWKCPCCDVVSATSQAAQRHMDTHAGVKAFRCTICRYKGNTLRGMRTHIRMHFQKKPQDLQEESYIACVVEEDGSRESSSPAAAGAGAAAAGGGERVHRCGACAYSSTYRGNVVRHARLVHAGGEAEPLETEPEPPRVKLEPEDEVTVSAGPGPNYCKSCDISFKYINTFIAHKKHYCSSHAGEVAAAQANNNLPGRVSEAPVQ